MLIVDGHEHLGVIEAYDDDDAAALIIVQVSSYKGDEPSAIAQYIKDI